MLPSSVGVGPYTAAAVGSIAFNDAAAAVDGNVIRVVSRLRALKGDPRKLAALHSDLAQQLLDPVRPGCFNQAGEHHWCPCATAFGTCLSTSH